MKEIKESAYVMCVCLCVCLESILYVMYDGEDKNLQFFVFRCLNCSRILERKEYKWQRLTAEAVQGLALSLQRVDDIHGGDRLSSGVFGVRNRITDNVFQEHLQDTSGFFVD